MSENQNDLPLGEAEERTKEANSVGVRYPSGTTRMERVPTKRIQLVMMPGPATTDNSWLFPE